MRSSGGLQRIFIIVAVTLLVAATLAYALAIRPAVLRSRQIMNLQQMRHLNAEIESFRQVHASYPGSFAGLDGWGHSVSYLSDGKQYLLVSYGRDGRPDGSDYGAMREVGKLRNEPCTDVDADIIFSDRGELRNCGK